MAWQSSDAGLMVPRVLKDLKEIETVAFFR
jgi:hypothetical protein